MGSVEEPAVRLDDALFQGRGELRCVAVEAADEVEALHMVAVQFENLALEDAELNAVDLGELGDEIDVATAAGGVGHKVAAVVASGVGQRMTGHAASVALVFRRRGYTAGDDVTVERQVK